ncbi:MAG: hypothetical protein A2259_05035 [Candidatus Moranbacteria bacterium RIFOXYA2_FULL_43_15]|nr:MAG: hypothetical protein A2259_05035 [Candidatus Moranbacteria bacterium RIFOXYA2_FULL_43_15]
MNAEQTGLWSSLDLARRETDAMRAHDIINTHSKSLLSPEIRRKIDEVTKNALQEIQRLGGDVESSRGSVENTADMFFQAIVSSAIPEEVVNSKCPPEPV